MMIILIRHATPKIDYSACDFHTARHRLADYNHTHQVEQHEIDAFMSSPLFRRITGQPLTIYTSPTPRAESTCQQLFQSIANYNVIPELREAGLAIVPLPFLKLKVTNWFFISRLAWLIGLSSEKERVSQVVNRAKSLLSLFETNTNVALVSHGFLLHYLKRQLSKQHYRLSEKFKQGCFSVEIWHK